MPNGCPRWLPREAARRREYKRWGEKEVAPGGLEQGVVQKTREQRLKVKEVKKAERRACRQRKEHLQSKEAPILTASMGSPRGAPSLTTWHYLNMVNRLYSSIKSNVKKKFRPRPGPTIRLYMGGSQEPAVHGLFWKYRGQNSAPGDRGCRCSGCPSCGRGGPRPHDLCPESLPPAPVHSICPVLPALQR